MSEYAYGLGICVDDIHTTIDKVKKLMAMSDDVMARFGDCIQECEEDAEGDAQTFADYIVDGTGGTYDGSEAGLATLMAWVIEDCEGIHLLADYDSTCSRFLMLEKKLPWQYSLAERNLTETMMNAIFGKYVSVLMDEPIDVEMYSID